MAKLQLPTRTETVFVEHRGEHREQEIEDRPYRAIEAHFNELRGEFCDIEQPLTDYEILEAGGLNVFFNDDGSRKTANWPWSGTDKAKKKVAKKKKVSKKK